MTEEQLRYNVETRDRDYAEALITAHRPRIQGADILEARARSLLKMVEDDNMTLLKLNLRELEDYLRESMTVWGEFK
jgi:hypothetical protein